MTAIDRFSTSAAHTRSMDQIAATRSRLSALQNQVSSGRAFERVSEDPGAARSAMSLRSEQLRNAQYAKNIDRGLLMLNASRIHVDSVNSQLLRARDLLVQGQQPNATPSMRSALAEQVEVIKSSLMIDANAQFAGRTLFGGSTSATSAYNDDGTYAGDTKAVTIRADADSSVRIELNGPEIFGADASNVFVVLTSIAANLRTAPGALGADLTSLDALRQRAGDAQAIVGSRINQLNELKDLTADRDVSLAGALSAAQDTDLSKAIMELTLQQTGYEAALRSTASVMQTSLMDFLK